MTAPPWSTTSAAADRPCLARLSFSARSGVLLQLFLRSARKLAVGLHRRCDDRVPAQTATVLALGGSSVTSFGDIVRTDGRTSVPDRRTPPSPDRRGRSGYGRRVGVAADDGHRPRRRDERRLLAAVPADMDDRADHGCYDARPRLDTDLLGLDDNPITNVNHWHLQTLGTATGFYPRSGDRPGFSPSGWDGAQ